MDRINDRLKEYPNLGPYEALIRDILAISEEYVPSGGSVVWGLWGCGDEDDLPEPTEGDVEMSFHDHGTHRRLDISYKDGLYSYYMHTMNSMTNFVSYDKESLATSFQWLMKWSG